MKIQRLGNRVKLKKLAYKESSTKLVDRMTRESNDAGSIEYRQQLVEEEFIKKSSDKKSFAEN
jgi:hypothetical protein